MNSQEKSRIDTRIRRIERIGTDSIRLNPFDLFNPRTYHYINFEYFELDEF